MPVQAAALADVLVGDHHPPMSLRRGDHRLEQAAVRLLDLGLPCELGARVAGPPHERVPDALEISGREDPRPAHRADAPLEPLAGKCGREQLSELALERGDLAAQIVACAALVRGRRIPERRH
jgi:hypothetical protein